MSKKAYKVQASSSRAASGTFGNTSAFQFGASGSQRTGFRSSQLSYIYEPPNLSVISNAQVAVAFKNLQKKDATTKVKALEELQTVLQVEVQQNGSLEEGVVDAWKIVFPRCSIENSRRVRQLAFSLHGEIAAAYGKQFARYMPDFIAVWLAGQYDGDKSVTQAVRESIKRIFPSQDKYHALWKVYQTDIFEYSQSVIEFESPGTLSDERNTKTDDANAKFDRALGAAILLVRSLLEQNAFDDLSKVQGELLAFLRSDRIWEQAVHTDPSVRKAVFSLLDIVIKKRAHALDPATISSYLLTQALANDQKGSSLEYVRVLLDLTFQIPSVWTDDYQESGKKIGEESLELVPREWIPAWSTWLLEADRRASKAIPLEIFIQTPNGPDVTEPRKLETPWMTVLEATRKSLNRKDEPRANLSAGWSAYMALCDRVTRALLSPDERKQLAESFVLPIVKQCVIPSQSNDQWSLPPRGPLLKTTATKAAHVSIQADPAAFNDAWIALNMQLIEAMKTSPPEQAKNYSAAQDEITKNITNYHELQASIVYENEIPHDEIQIFGRLDIEVDEAVSLLRNRNGKPYSAAAALMSILNHLKPHITENQEMKDKLCSFANQDILHLLNSPSGPYLVECVMLLRGDCEVQTVLSDAASALIESTPSTQRTQALRFLFGSVAIRDEACLQAAALKLARQTLDEDESSDWPLMEVMLTNSALPRDAGYKVLEEMEERLSHPGVQRIILGVLQNVSQHNTRLMQVYVESARGSHLIAKLLRVTDASDEETARQSERLSDRLQKLLLSETEASSAFHLSIGLIKKDFERVDHESRSVQALVKHARKVIADTSDSHLQSIVSQILPSDTQLSYSLTPFISNRPHESLASLSPFGEAVSLIQLVGSSSTNIERDSEGSSLAIRLAQYVVGLLDDERVLSGLQADTWQFLCRFLAVLLQVVQENIDLPSDEDIQLLLSPEADEVLVSLTPKIQSLAVTLLQHVPPQDVVAWLHRWLLDEASSMSSSAYYHARAFLFVTFMEVTSQSAKETGTQVNFSALIHEPRTFRSLALLIASEAQVLLQPINETISELTGADSSAKTQDFLWKCIFLNIMTQQEDGVLEKVAKQRLVFLVKHFINQLDSASVSIEAEVFKILNVILPVISEIYGEFWMDLSKVLTKVLETQISEETLSTVIAALRLIFLLLKLDIGTSNEDVSEAWSAQKPAIITNLLKLVMSMKDLPDVSHQPRRVLNETLERVLLRLSNHIPSLDEDLYSVLASQSLTLQSTVFRLFDHSIPLAQRKTSIEKAINNRYTASLPDELLSLLALPSVPEDLNDLKQDDVDYISPRSYLLSWKLVFDHWTNASNSVRSDYSKAIQEGTYIAELLQVICHLLITSRSKPLDASKLDATTYEVSDEVPSAEIERLSTHLYYQLLLYLPTPTKNWWRDGASRQLNTVLQSWTEKYISPLIISSELNDVKKWASEQESEFDDSFAVKVSQNTREITASVPVDEQQTTIAIRLPPAYPLARAEVSGVHRVAITENKWQSWIRNAQGQLTISDGGSGSLIDCLLAWRRNVTAAMKGQTECAVCYSVVGADKTLPKKECPTCKKRFHAGCLYRWFKSSNSSSCPLCRNTFTYA